MSPVPLFDPAALRSARLAAGLTQADLARRLDMAGGERVSQWERGVTTPHSPALLRAIARALGVEVTSLTRDDDADPDSPITPLTRLRVKAGLSREVLADRVHVSITTVERWEHGDYVRPPSRDIVRLLAKALRQPIREIDAVLAAAARPPAPRRRRAKPADPISPILEEPDTDTPG